MKAWTLLLLAMTGPAWGSAVGDLRQAMDHNFDPKARASLPGLVAPAVAEATAEGNPLVLGEVLYIKANIESRLSRDYEGSLLTLHQAAVAVANLKTPDSLGVQMDIWIEQGSLNQYLGRFDQAEAFFEEALKRARSRKSPKAEARALFRLGQLKYRRNDIVQALSYLDEASLRLLEQDDPELRLKILSTKGRIFRLNHAYDKAQDFLQQALALAQELNDHKAVPDLLVATAVTYEEMGDSNSALLESLHALDLYRQQNRTLSEAKVLLNIASLYQNDPAQHPKAMEYLDQAVTIYRKNKVNFYLGTALSMRAPLLADPGQGIQDLKDALGYFDERDDVSSWRERQKAQMRLADLYEKQGQQTLAIAALRAAMALQQELDSDDLQDGRQAMEQLTEQLNQADRLRRSEQQRLTLDQQRSWWRQSTLLTAVLALATMLGLLWLWRQKHQLQLALAEDRRTMAHHGLSGLVNQRGLAPLLQPLLEASQQAHNQSRERETLPQEPLVFISLDARFVQRLPMLAGIEESRELVRRYVATLEEACSHCEVVAQLADDHLLLVLKDEPSLLPSLYKRLSELTARFVMAEGLEDVRVAVGFNLFPTLAQRSSPLPVDALVELARFTLAQAVTLLEETRQSTWVSIQALELAPPSLLDVDNAHLKLQEALDRGLLQLRSGH
ncbi:tetratricopeptide repeat protein [Gallaecimonas xiamenensis]|uniref:tetratricopeptide repeat protein n=1 Tax=Gallaecimonas xiamenensis TaxID=1207039 RepID=UPI00178C3380|nr:tetratricopeptide repeat protein [Gallaecimonas xiamenensis]